jgi:hypothetical protein
MMTLAALASAVVLTWLWRRSREFRREDSKADTGRVVRHARGRRVFRGPPRRRRLPLGATNSFREERVDFRGAVAEGRQHFARILADPGYVAARSEARAVHL